MFSHQALESPRGSRLGPTITKIDRPNEKYYWERAHHHSNRRRRRIRRTSARWIPSNETEEPASCRQTTAKGRETNTRKCVHFVMTPSNPVSLRLLINLAFFDRGWPISARPKRFASTDFHCTRGKISIFHRLDLVIYARTHIHTNTNTTRRRRSVAQ